MVAKLYQSHTIKVVALFAVTSLSMVSSGRDNPVDSSNEVYARITFYTLQGIMANGEWVHEGAAACSRDLPMGTLVTFRDGRQVQCKDRGILDCGIYWCPIGVSTWIDIWAPYNSYGLAYIEGVYGVADIISIE